MLTSRGPEFAFGNRAHRLGLVSPWALPSNQMVGCGTTEGGRKGPVKHLRSEKEGDFKTEDPCWLGKKSADDTLLPSRWQQSASVSYISQIHVSVKITLDPG